MTTFSLREKSLIGWPGALHMRKKCDAHRPPLHFETAKVPPRRYDREPIPYDARYSKVGIDPMARRQLDDQNECMGEARPSLPEQQWHNANRATRKKHMMIKIPATT